MQSTTTLVVPINQSSTLVLPLKIAVAFASYTGPKRTVFFFVQLQALPRGLTAINSSLTLGSPTYIFGFELVLNTREGIVSYTITMFFKHFVVTVLMAAAAVCVGAPALDDKDLVMRDTSLGKSGQQH